MTQSKTSEMLALYQNALDHLKANDFRDKERLIEYYDRYYEIVKDHKPIIDEAWKAEGVTRHGWTDIKGTVSEMLTTYYCAKVQRWRVFPIVNKREQGFGADLLIEQGIKQERISVKSVKSWRWPADDSTRFNLDADFFEPGLFRVTFISLVDPLKNQMWLLNYEALAREYCTISERHLCTPKFENYTYMCPEAFKEKYPGTMIHVNLNGI